MARAPLLGCDAIGKAYGSRLLFDGLTFGLFEGDHVGLVGPNGSGKSTLLRILAGLETPDRGTRSLRGGVRVGYVPQDPTFSGDVSVGDVVAVALAHVDESERPGRVALALGRAGFGGGQAAVTTLSGGWKKRLAIAREIAAEPEIVLMDEPTNHLDVEGILWLEGLLTAQTRAFVVVSHDRYFLEHVATRMLELDRAYPDGLFQTDGRYSDFLARRTALLEGRAAYQESLANTVRREIAWLRRGAKARTTKARGRIKEAGRLMEELRDAKARTGARTVDLDFTSSERRTKKLLVARGLTKSCGGRLLVKDLDLTITPGTRVGVIGPNGSGKTTLLGMLAGTLAPDAGEVERADGLSIVRFEQERSGLDRDQPLRLALAADGDAVTAHGRTVHVAAWARRFLFRPEQLELAVGRLSGGEQARVLIARLMREPADVLVLDEPTNDLDIPTLQVLEDSLAEFAGAVVLVTHDRFLLDRVSTMVLALDGEGGVETFADYAQWETSRATARRAPREALAPLAAPRERPRPRRLGYREQREWDGMEQAILDAERRAEACRRAADDPAIACDAGALQERHAALAAARAEVDRLYARWAELEQKLGAPPPPR
jgi:ABC transport system ATP-binding/permease protein